MKILFLADPGSSHTIKWARALDHQKIELFIVGLSAYKKDDYKDTNIQVVSLFLDKENFGPTSRDVSKAKYLKLVPQVKQIILKFKPDILHAHYASSYGLLGALTKFHPFIISVWGSDIYKFGEKSIIHKNLLKYNFKKADMVLSTSKDMAERTKKFTKKPILITPFGVDPNKFYPLAKNDDEIVVGTVKSLESIYGIDLLIKAFSMLNGDKLALEIVGDGSQIEVYKTLVADLKISDKVRFIGRIDQADVPEALNRMDIFVAASRSESFGVSVIEASSCGLPVVSSNVGGLPEVIVNEKTGFIVPSGDVESLKDKIQHLVNSSSLRAKMGIAGRKFVLEHYVWDDCVDKMISIYKNINHE
jgi:L-malate glycosyltransferase